MQTQGKTFLQKCKHKKKSTHQRRKNLNIWRKHQEGKTLTGSVAARMQIRQLPLVRHLAGKKNMTHKNIDYVTQNLRSAAEAVILASHAISPPQDDGGSRKRDDSRNKMLKSDSSTKKTNGGWKRAA